MSLEDSQGNGVAGLVGKHEACVHFCGRVADANDVFAAKECQEKVGLEEVLK
ncbi:hypothetical protein [Deinococcus sp. Leaf326]|uniref:hypothetical protein n=1 Tax=Deinococcus sp. Leaf326 TaxID=1736338 RepID=UPI0012E2139D|nr:hypothetical protein [Deinococcus sp. Leaf326]